LHPCCIPACFFALLLPFRTSLARPACSPAGGQGVGITLLRTVGHAEVLLYRPPCFCAVVERVGDVDCGQEVKVAALVVPVALLACEQAQYSGWAGGQVVGSIGLGRLTWVEGQWSTITPETAKLQAKCRSNKRARDSPPWHANLLPWPALAPPLPPPCAWGTGSQACLQKRVAASPVARGTRFSLPTAAVGQAGRRGGWDSEEDASVEAWSGGSSCIAAY